MAKRALLIWRPTLERHGWTDELIRKFLGQHGNSSGPWNMTRAQEATVRAGLPPMEFLGWSTLTKERGWTDELIDQLLGEPDYEGENPHYVTGPALRLFLLWRVEAAEQAPALMARKRRLEARRLCGLMKPDLSSAPTTAYVRGLARDGQAAILADALEDGGFNNAEVLEHLRNVAEHTRSCPVLRELRKRVRPAPLAEPPTAE